MQTLSFVITVEARDAAHAAGIQHKLHDEFANWQTIAKQVAASVLEDGWHKKTMKNATGFDFWRNGFHIGMVIPTADGAATAWLFLDGGAEKSKRCKSVAAARSQVEVGF